MGWKVTGPYDALPDKCVLVVAPHTSTKDFWVGWVCRTYIGFKAKFLAKSELFKGATGWFLRKAGGFPVDRSKKANRVDQVVQYFYDNPVFRLAVTPEGTRKYAENWKTGFYWIALNAKVPIVMIGFDFASKTIEFKDAFYPTGDKDADIETMKAYFRTVTGAVPENGVR